MTSGVYQIRHIQFPYRRYVGSSINLEYRGLEHYRNLLAGNHENDYLQNAVNKYGINSFVFEILEECDNYREREQFYLDMYWPINILYNLSPIVGTPGHSPEAMRRMVESRRAKGSLQRKPGITEKILATKRAKGTISKGGLRTAELRRERGVPAFSEESYRKGRETINRNKELRRQACLTSSVETSP